MRRLKSMPKAGSLLHATVPVYASIAHSAECVAVIIAGDPIGVDLESMRRKRDLSAAAALLGLAGGGSGDSSGLARMGDGRSSTESRSQRELPSLAIYWEACQLAVAGSPSPPLAGVFDGMAGIYNATALQWEAV